MQINQNIYISNTIPHSLLFGISILLWPIEIKPIRMAHKAQPSPRTRYLRFSVRMNFRHIIMRLPILIDLFYFILSICRNLVVRITEHSALVSKITFHEISPYEKSLPVLSANSGFIRFQIPYPNPTPPKMLMNRNHFTSSFLPQAHSAYVNGDMSLK